MAVKIPSKFELRRFCRTTGAAAMVKNEPPSAEDLGYVKEMVVQEVGGTVVTVIRQDEAVGKMATVLLRASTEQVPHPCCVLLGESSIVGNPSPFERIPQRIHLRTAQASHPRFTPLVI